MIAQCRARYSLEVSANRRFRRAYIPVEADGQGNTSLYRHCPDWRIAHLLGREDMDVPTSRLELEVTETVFMGRGADYVDRALKVLSAAGVKIALDDFGTGYASLTHLQKYPVDVIKIDRGFVRNLDNNPSDSAIVDAVINLGRSLGLSVVAEGIETMSQARQLLDRNCELGQGYLFGEAVPPESVPALISA